MVGLAVRDRAIAETDERPLGLLRRACLEDGAEGASAVVHAWLYLPECDVASRAVALDDLMPGERGLRFTPLPRTWTG